MAPQVGFEPTTDRLTVDCSTPELLRNIFIYSITMYADFAKYFYKNNKFIIVDFLLYVFMIILYIIG